MASTIERLYRYSRAIFPNLKLQIKIDLAEDREIWHNFLCSRVGRANARYDLI